MNKQEEKIEHEDEISLSDIIKLLYKYKKFLIIFFIISFALLTVILFIGNTGKRHKWEIISILEYAKFQDNYVYTPQELHKVITSGFMLKTCIKKFGKEEIYKLITGEDLTDEEEKNWNEILIDLCKLWEENIELKDANLVLTTKYIQTGVKVNEYIAEFITEMQNKKLEELRAKYIEELNKIVKMASKSISKSQILLSSPTLPSYRNAQIILKASANLPTIEKRTSRKLILIIGAVIIIFIEIILVFIIEGLRKIDWKEIKQNAKEREPFNP